MARLEDNQNHGLPPPPAATRRSANPWKFSETGRKPEPRPEPIGQQLLEEWMQEAPVEEGSAHEALAHEGPAHEAPAHREAPPPAAPARARPGLWFMVIAVVVILVALRIFFEARANGDWAKLIGPLVLIAFIAHGWWRARQRREAKKTKLN
jgi:hypothetical protein